MESILSQLNATEIADCTGGVLASGAGNMPFSNVSIDTRTLNTGDLFFAIRGPNNDGHRFIQNALSKGAHGAVAESRYVHPGKFPLKRALIQVEDTHQALKDLASDVYRRWNGTMVGITGSMGKTTVKEFVSQIMQIACNVYRSPGNYNNLYGLPLAVLGLQSNHSIGIFEMGMSAPGEIAEMCRIAQPAIGIITNVAPVHLEFFDSLKEIAYAKEELVQALPAEGTLIYNWDDPLVRDMAARFRDRKVSFGFSDGADFQADQIEVIDPKKTRFRLSYSGTHMIVTIPLAGAHFVMNTLPAIALGNLYGISQENISESLRQIRSTSMRGGILHFAKGFSVIDDSYNSNPKALKSMIDVLSGLPSFKRRLLVAGEMLELGSDSESLHYECGAYAAGVGIDEIIGIRGIAQEFVSGALQSGMNDSQVHFFPDADEASDYLNKEMRSGDLALVKGSRGVHMETLIQNLCSKFEQIGQ